MMVMVENGNSKQRWSLAKCIGPSHCGQHWHLSFTHTRPCDPWTVLPESSSSLPLSLRAHNWRQITFCICKWHLENTNWSVIADPSELLFLFCVDTCDTATMILKQWGYSSSDANFTQTQMGARVRCPQQVVFSLLSAKIAVKVSANNWHHSAK